MQVKLVNQVFHCQKCPSGMTLASPSIHTSLHMFCWEERRIKEEDGLREGFDCKAASQQTSLSLSLFFEMDLFLAC